MATKDEGTAKTAATSAKAAPAKAAEPAAKEAETKAAAKDGPIVSTCVVNGGRGMHVGNAVNGKVCSYHAMHYDAAGNRR